jgi:hypothetical protein
MATEAQIAANRANAQKSTGPQTVDGKAKVGQNAVKHGLFSQKNVVISENQVEFDLLEGEMLEELAPVGVMETMLAERIVSLTWRLKRAEWMQNEFIDYQIMRIIDFDRSDLSKSLITGQPQEKPGKYDDVALGFIANRDFGGDRTLERLAMYERRFELSLYKTMAEFKKLQQARKTQETKSGARAIPPLGKATTRYIGNEAVTHLKKQTQSRPDLSTPLRFAQDDKENEHLTKQSQFENYEDEYELSDFEKREHELLTSHVLSENNLSPREANFG